MEKNDRLSQAIREALNLMIITLAMLLIVAAGSYLTAVYLPLDFDGSIANE